MSGVLSLFASLWQSWQKSSRKTRKRRKARRPRVWQLRLEALEERVVPSLNSVLLLGSEGGVSDEPSVRNALASTGVLGGASITYLDTTNSTPSLSTLQQYKAVLAWTDFLPQDPTALGNVLAQYVDNGGALVISTYSTSGSSAISGNIQTTGYDPFLVESPGYNWAGSGTTYHSLTSYAASHPIFTGITGFPTYWTESGYVNAPLSSGAYQLGRDNFGNQVIAVNSKNNVVGINIYPNTLGGATTDSQVYRLFDNALLFASHNPFAPVVSSSGNQSSTEGGSHSFSLGSFADPDGGWTVDVNWGDSTAHTTFTAGSYSLGSANHTYAEEGTYTVTVKVTDSTSLSGSATFQASVSDPAITPTGGYNFSAVEGAALATQTVATFTDPGGAEALVDYSANINWGDGSTSAGTITASGGVFTVKGSHPYSEEGSYTATVTISHDSAPTATATSQAFIFDPPILASAQGPFTAMKGTGLGTVTVATFTHGTVLESGITALINWGVAGHTADAGTVLSDGGGSYHVTGTSPVYAQEGTYTISVGIFDDSTSAGTSTTVHVKANPTLTVGSSSGSWSTVASMHTARGGLAAATSNGLIYAIGGESTNGQALNAVEVYNSNNNSWSTNVAGMPTPRYVLAAAAGADGSIYAIGGFNSTSGVLNTLEVYNPDTKTWTTPGTVPGMNTARVNLNSFS